MHNFISRFLKVFSAQPRGFLNSNILNCCCVLFANELTLRSLSFPPLPRVVQVPHERCSGPMEGANWTETNWKRFKTSRKLKDQGPPPLLHVGLSYRTLILPPF